jgi:hypothetical protein
MSDREAFEKHCPMPKGLVFNASLNRYDGGVYTSALSYNDMWCAWQHAWQAALQSGEPVAVADRGVLNWIDGKQFAREADLYTNPQPVVPEVVFDILKAAQGSCRLGLNDIADKQIQVAIKALLSAGKGGE